MNVLNLFDGMRAVLVLRLTAGSYALVLMPHRCCYKLAADYQSKNLILKTKQKK